MKNLERIIVYCLLLVVSTFLVFYVYKKEFGSNDQNKISNKNEPFHGQKISDFDESINIDDLKKNNKTIPDYVLYTLAYIRKNDQAPDGYRGGRKFFNREGKLPQLENDFYREWDVHPLQNGKNRGAERLVTSKLKSYFTKDHYHSFLEIKE